jgi:hypothetical protein
MLEADEWMPETFNKYLADEVLLAGTGQGGRSEACFRRHTSWSYAIEPHL